MAVLFYGFIFLGLQIFMRGAYWKYFNFTDGKLEHVVEGESADHIKVIIGNEEDFTKNDEIKKWLLENYEKTTFKGEDIYIRND